MTFPLPPRSSTSATCRRSFAFVAPLPSFHNPISPSPVLSCTALRTTSFLPATSAQQRFRPALCPRPQFTPHPAPTAPLTDDHIAPRNPARTVATPTAALFTLSPTILISLGGLVAFALSAALGANDVANSLGTAVGTGAIKVATALSIGAVMEFAGAVLFGSTVTKTISSGVVTIGAATLTAPVNYMLGMLTVLIGCTVWLAVATRFGLPVSSTHSVVGSLIGLGLVSGWGINYGAVKRIVASWFLSPLIGGIISTTLYKTISILIINAERPARATRRFLPVLTGGACFVVTMFVLGNGSRFTALSPDRIVYIALGIALGCSGLTAGMATAIHSREYITRKFGISHDGTITPGSGPTGDEVTIEEQRDDVERIFKVLQVVTACLLAFSHGSNDVSNAIGPFAAMYSMWQNGGRIDGTVSIPPWVLVLGGLGISTGLGLFGKPVMETVGKKITKLRPTMGFCVELSTALTVLMASELGLPLSTTHTLIGCIVAIGIANGDASAVNKSILVSIAGSWGVTLPFSAIVTMLAYVALRPFLPVTPVLL